MSTVTECIQVRTWTSKDGTKSAPIFKVKLSSGQEGEAFGKPIPLGTPQDQLEITSDSYGVKFKLKGEAKAFNKFQRKDEPKNPGMALAFAKDLAVAGKINVTELLQKADKLYDWLESKKPKEATVAQTTQQAQDDPDKLPF